MTAPRTSVVLPVRNGQAHISAALDSLFAQTDSNFEIIAVDDASTDETLALLSHRSFGDNRLHVLSTRLGPEQGIVAALNLGISVAKGRYIARMDADDICHTDRLRLQAEYLDRHADVGLVASRVQFAGDRRAQRGLALFVDWTNELLTPADIARSRFIETPIVHPSVMFRHELVELHGGYRSGDYPEDYELWLRWLDRGVQFAKLPQSLLKWTDRQNRLTRSDPRYGAEAFFRVKAPYIARWLAANNPAHPQVVVWGAGRAARLRFRWLAAEGVVPTAYIDIDPKKIGWKIAGVPVISVEEIPADAFVLIYVGKRGARQLIEDCLGDRPYLACA